MTRPDPDERVRVVPYDPRWPGLFEEERRLVAAALGPGLVAVEHIGSTSVPGLAAKPVIDIMAGLERLELTAAQIDALERLGYEFLGDHGIPGRLYFRKGRPRSHHIHAVVYGGPSWERHLALRDYLRAHADEARRYGELKQRVAADVGGHRGRYLRGKDAFVAELEERARAWRARSSLTP